jgi:hypothetical protein
MNSDFYFHIWHINACACSKKEGKKREAKRVEKRTKENKKRSLFWSSRDT